MLRGKQLLSDDNEKVVKTACHLCHGGCILLAHIKEGKIVKVRGDPDGPLNRGGICEKAAAAVDYVYSPYRLKYPMKRVGERGQGKWQRISWDEALDITIKKLSEIKEKYGGESIAYACGTGRVVVEIPRVFFNAVLDTPNFIGIGHMCLSTTRRPVVYATLGKIPGNMSRGACRDFERSSCIVAWGDSVIDSRNDYMGLGGKRISAALKRGAKLIVIDPVLTKLAAKADIWLQIRPGTDIALALSWLNVIINEELYDKELVEKWTNAPFLIREDTGKLLRHSDIVAGTSNNKFVIWDTNRNAPNYWDTHSLSYDISAPKPALLGSYPVRLATGDTIQCKPVWQLVRDNVEEWTPQRAAEITWLSANMIIESARMYALTKPASIEWGLGTSQCTRSTATNQAILHLKAITGNLDIPGGNPFWVNPGFIERTAFADISPGQEEKRINGGFPFSRCEIMPVFATHAPSAWRAILNQEPYPIKALIGHSSNPLLGHENPGNYILEALKKLEFIVWIDITMTPSNEWADIILPASTPLERDWISEFDMGIYAGRALIEPLWESKSDFDIYKELCWRMGREDVWPWKTEREWCEYRLEGMGITFDDLVKTCFKPAPEIWKKYEKGLLRGDEKPGFTTESGKVEIYSSLFEKAGIKALPAFTYPPESYETTPQLAEDYPLILITGARGLDYPYFQTQYRFLDKLRKMQPFPMILINPETARELDIKNDDWAWIETQQGRAQFKARVTDGIHSKVVSASHDWWYPEKQGPDYGAFESNVNLLVNPFSYTDPASGTTELRGLLCRVYKV